MEKVYGYARVSTREQNLDRQIAALRQYIADERDIITDKESGKDFNRPGYQYLREVLLRPGDTLIVKSLDRLGRNKQQVKQELEYYKAMGVRVKIIDLPSTMADFPKGQDSRRMDDRPMRLERQGLRSCRRARQAGFGACESGWCNRKRCGCPVGCRQSLGKGEIRSGNLSGSELYRMINR